MTRGPAWTTGLGFAVFLTAHSAAADDARLAEAQRHYQALDFEKCVAALAAPPPTESTTADHVNADVMKGVCQFELGRTTEALERFRAALRTNPKATLPPYSSPKIVEAFASAEADVRAESEKSAASGAPRVTPPLVFPAERPAPKRGGIPTLSLVLGGGACAFAALAAYGALRGNGLAADADNAHFESDAYSLGERAKGFMVTANIGLIGALVLATAAVVVGFTTDPR